MKYLFYRIAAFCIVTPILLWTLVAPLLSMASTIGNIAGIVIALIIGIEGVFIGSKLVTELNERIDQ